MQALAALLAHGRLPPAATTFASELAGLVPCERAAVGFVEDHFAQVVAISHGTLGNERSTEIEAIAAAMDECADQAATVRVPARADELPRIALAHEELTRHGCGGACSIPIIAEQRVIGAVTLMFRRGEELDGARIAACEHLVALAAPVFELLRHRDRRWRKRLTDALARGWRHLRSPAGRRARWIMAGIAGAALVLLGVPVQYEVGGNARVEGQVQRLLVAPGDGFLERASVRPGDAIRAGDVLAELAEQDLLLERTRWASEMAAHQNAYALAMARADRAEMVISQAKANEAGAQLARVDEQLERIRITAPFDGVVIAGDLTQSLGAPVQRGDVLLTVAPDGAYRVIVDIDERDIGRVQIGQRGSLALSALPWDTLPITITRITPMAKAVEGLNVFEVEADLGDTAGRLRPGERGVARIAVGREPLAWIWSHRLVDRLRLQSWAWLGY